MMLHIDVIMWF